jgi:hypothetical protein
LFVVVVVVVVVVPSNERGSGRTIDYSYKTQEKIQLL